ncbi:unnamed protein product [Calypogeia fissa]
MSFQHFFFQFRRRSYCGKARCVVKLFISATNLRVSILGISTNLKISTFRPPGCNRTANWALLLSSKYCGKAQCVVKLFISATNLWLERKL